MKTVKIEVPIARQFMKHYKELSDWERVTEATKAIDEVKAIRKEIFNRPVSNKMKIIDECNKAIKKLKKIRGYSLNATKND